MRNFRSLWGTVEAFGEVCQEYTRRLVDAELARNGIGSPDATQLKAAKMASSEQVKTALLISGASRSKYGELKDELANNYLLGTNQYPDTYEKAQRIPANYQNTKAGALFRASPDDTGVTFLQRGGGRGGRGAGRGGQEGRGARGTKGVVHANVGHKVTSLTFS